MLNKLLSARAGYLLGFVASFASVGLALWIQTRYQLNPCPLCISQRLAILLTGIIFLIAVLHNPGSVGINCYAILGAISALFGASISTRHVWLQHLPPELVPECSPGISFMLQNFPLFDTVKLMLNGTGDCAKIDWTLLGFSMPAWTLVAFLSLAALSVLQIWNRHNP